MYIYMYIFSEKGRRGEISCVSDRYSKAKNKYLKYYDPKHELKHRCLDANNLQVMQCVNFSQQEDSNGQILKSLT